MSGDVTFTVVARCPECDYPAWREVDALVDSGSIPQNEFTCPSCGCEHIVEAVVDLAIYPRAAVRQATEGEWNE